MEANTTATANVKIESSTGAAEGTQKRATFVALPGELRNRIYEYVSGHYIPTLHLRAGAKLICVLPLAAVSHQVRGEFVSVVRASCCSIRAQVVDLDFTHVTEFLSDHSSSKDPGVSHTEGVLFPNMHIVLYTTTTGACQGSSLDLWLRERGEMLTKGIGPQVTYTVHRSCTYDIKEVKVSLAAIRDLLHHFIPRKRKMAEGHSKAELEEIISLLNSDCRLLQRNLEEMYRELEGQRV